MKKNSGLSRSLFFSALFLEVSLGAVFVRSGTGPMFWILHGTASLCLAWALRLSLLHIRKNRAHPVYLHGFLLTLFFPLLGLGIALLIYFGLRYYSGTSAASEIVEEYQKNLRPDTERSELMHSRDETLRRFRSELNFESFVDVLQSETKERAKANVIEKLSKNLTPENVSLLRLALRDTSAEVRMYAAGALIQLEGDLNRRILAAKREARKTGTPSSWAESGELYQRYAESGLLDETLCQYYRNLAVHAYRSSLDLDTNQPQVVANYLRCLYSLRDFTRAEAMMNHALKTWPQDKKLLILGAEFDFQTHQYKSCQEKLTRIDSASLDSQEKEVHSFWLSPL